MRGSRCSAILSNGFKMTIYHTIYESTNLINGKVYRGKHSTTDPYDKYLGSGTAMLAAVSKYGSRNFRKEILFMAFTIDDLDWIEGHEFVTLAWICTNKKNTYNQVRGGASGYTKRSKTAEERREETMMKLYSVKHPYQSPEIMKKMKDDNLEKFGVENTWQCENSKLAMYEKHGVEYGLQSPKILQKTKDTLFQKYGVDNPLKHGVIREKLVDSWIEKYGVDNPMKSEEVQNKAKQTCMDRYGVEHSFMSPISRANRDKTMMATYSCLYPMQNAELKEQAAQTYFKKTGYRNPGQNPESRKKGMKTLLARNGGINPAIFKRWLTNHTAKLNAFVNGTEVESLVSNDWVFGRTRGYLMR